MMDLLKWIIKLTGILCFCLVIMELFYVASNCEFSNTFYKQIFNEKEETLSISNDILQTQMMRKKALFKYCKLKPQKVNRSTSYLIYSEKEKLLYCYIPKVASTTWKRLFQMFEGQLSFENASNIDKNDIHKLSYKKMVGIKKEEDRALLERNFFSFIITRHPFERLVATYRNKFEDPYTPYFQKAYGSRILRKFRRNLSRSQYNSGAGVTFHEFIKFILTSRTIDEHWSKMTDLCLPCSYKYDYIAKMETLVNDSNAILEITSLFEKYPFLENSTDRYNVKTSEIVESYFKPVPKSDIAKLYKMYEDDFLAFGYSMPHFLKFYP